MNVSNADNNIASLQKQIAVLQGQLPSMTLSVSFIIIINKVLIKVTLNKVIAGALCIVCG